MELIFWSEYWIIISIILSGFISVISVYLKKIFVGDIFVNFDYIFDFKFASLIAVIRFVRIYIFPDVLFFTACEQESGFRLRERRKIFIFNYLRIWSVRVFLDLVIIVHRQKCEGTRQGRSSVQLRPHTSKIEAASSSWEHTHHKSEQF
jgi:hypothetical protein